MELKKNFCINCETSCYGVRCRPCSNKLNGLLNDGSKLRGKKLPDLSLKYSGIGNPNYKHGKTHNNRCIECDKIISFISIRCNRCHVHKFLRENPYFNKGINHPNYLHGKYEVKYPSKFNCALKDEVRERDNYVCQICRMTNEEHIIVYGYELVIHHIDYDKEKCSKENLTSLCIGCNSRANYNRNYWQEYFLALIKEKEKNLWLM